MTEGKVLIYSTDKIYQADLLMQVLADNGIKAFSINKKDSDYLFGFIEVYVNHDDAIRAKSLVIKFEE
mgnify:CR=1 FL=1